MPPPNLQLEDLLALAETLRGAGFAIGTQQYIAAHELLVALASRGRLPENPQDWRSLLAPVFCSSRREQEEFAGHFTAWLRRRPNLQVAVQTPRPEAGVATQQVNVRSSTLRRLRAALSLNRLKAGLRTRLQMLWHWFKRPVVAAVTTTLFLSAVGAAAYLSGKTERTLAGNVVDKDTRQPIPLANVAFADGTADTNGQGEFTLKYHIRNFDRLWRRRRLSAQVSQSGYEPATSNLVLLHHPEPQTIEMNLLPHFSVPLPQVQLATVTPTVDPTPPRLDPEVIPIKRRLWPAAIPLALYALWFLWRWLRRKLIAQKLQTSGTPRLQQLRLAREGLKLFDSPAFRRAVVELRRHRHIAANDLDVAATIRATIRQAGLFTPSFGRRRALPEYLLLIDRASLQDEQARVGDELARRFAAGEIGVERFYFQGDARICQQGPLAPALTLNELAARYPEHRLLIFGDGAGFFDQFSGEPQRWLEQFAQWPERALITPIEPGTQAEPQWGYREAVLQDQGFALLPATANGFEVLTAWLNTGLAPEPRGTAERPFPAMLAERPIRWMERRAPREEEAERLVAQLRRYLGESGWLWLRACAVYPQVTWELTLYLGARLLGRTPAEREAWGSDLLRLVRLPWFRYGALPDWLRAVLIAQFTPPEEIRVRGVIEDLLRHVLTKPGEAVSLELATRPPGDQRRWRRWLARIEQWLRRRALYRRLQPLPPESQLHDFVFLSFLAGRRLRPLTVQAPKLWERVLFDRGRWAFGPQPMTLGTLAALAAAALWWMFWLSPILKAPEPNAGNAPPNVMPTVPPDASFTPTPVPSRPQTAAKVPPSPSTPPTVSPDETLSPREVSSLQGHTGFVTSVAFSPDGRTLASGSWDRTVKLWDAKSGAELRTLKGHRDYVRSVAFSPDGRALASGSVDDTVKLWDARSGAELATLNGRGLYGFSVAFSPDGQTLVGNDDQLVKLWDARSGAELATLKGHRNSVMSVAFSPDGRTLASGSLDDTIKLWDAKSGAELATLKGHRASVESVAFSPDGRTVASGSYDRTVKLWDAKSGAELATLKGHVDSVMSVAFSPDGRMLATGSGDKTVKLWDVRSGQELATLKGHTDVVTSVAFSPDGRMLATGSGDLTVKLWNVERTVKTR